MMWMRVWTRAVIVPATRRAQGAWFGAVLVAGLVFGPSGMPPHDLTDLAWRAPPIFALLTTTWLLLVLPSARLLVRADRARYLRSLPGPRIAPVVAAALTLLFMQGPWLALWCIGDGVRGFAVVGVTSVVLAAVAAWQPAPRRARPPRWRSAGVGLRGVYMRALRRRASDALVRGLGLAVLAGLAAGLVVRNNALGAVDGARVGTSAIAIVLVPGWAGVLLPLLDAHRATVWLAATLGVSEARRRGELAVIVAEVYVAGALIAATASAALVDWATAGAIAAASMTGALATALVATRGLAWADRSEIARGLRVAVGAIVASAACVLALALFGLAGLAAIAAIGTLAVLA
jgi:hypothetical protein